MTRLAGLHAIVTGGGTGIGAAIARALADEGAMLTLVGRRRDKLDEAAAALPGAVAAPADVTRRDEVDAAFDAGRAKHGPIAILINNAGAAAATPFARITAEDWRAIMAVNLDGVFHCCQAALPDLLAAERARIVTIASIAGLRGGAYIAPYVAAKHGAVGLTRALAAEFAKTNLTVNAVCPGYVETDIVAGAVAAIQAKTGRSEEEARAALVSTNPQGRMIDPEEVAATVVWLCLPESRSVNGQAIAISGGDSQ